MKNLVLTAKGRRLKATIPGKIWNGPNTFSALTDDERSQFTDLLAKLVATTDVDGRGAPTAAPAAGSNVR